MMSGVDSHHYNIESIHSLLMGWIDSIKGCGSTQYYNGVDQLKTSLTVHTVYSMRLTEQVEIWERFKLMLIDDGARRSWDGAMDRLAGAASKILPSSNLLHKAENFIIQKLGSVHIWHLMFFGYLSLSSKIRCS